MATLNQMQLTGAEATVETLAFLKKHQASRNLQLTLTCLATVFAAIAALDVILKWFS